MFILEIIINLAALKSFVPFAALHCHESQEHLSEAWVAFCDM